MTNRNPSAKDTLKGFDLDTFVDSLPLYSSDLIDVLRVAFLKPSIVPGISVDEIFYLAGQQSVIDHLVQLKKEMENPDD